MSYKIQVTVDDQLNKAVKARAKRMGLSVSSYARLALKSVVMTKKENKWLDQAILDVRSNRVETLTLDEFKHQLDHL